MMTVKLRMLRSFTPTLLVVLGVLLFTHQAQAALIDTDDDGDWGTGSIWVGDAIPLATDSAGIRTAVTVTSSQAIFNVELKADTPTLAISGAGTVLTLGNRFNFVRGIVTQTDGSVAVAGGLGRLTGGSGSDFAPSYSISDGTLTVGGLTTLGAQRGNKVGLLRIHGGEATFNDQIQVGASLSQNKSHENSGTLTVDSGKATINKGLAIVATGGANGTHKVLGQTGILNVNGGLVEVTEDYGTGALAGGIIFQGVVLNRIKEAGTTLSSTLNLTGGTLDLGGKDILYGIDVSSITTNVTNTFNFSGGRLEDVGKFDVDILLNQTGGTLAAGGSVGTMAIDDGYTLGAGGTLEVELDSLASFDLYNVTGAADLSGTVAVKLGTYTPIDGDTFDVLTSTLGVTDSLASITSDNPNVSFASSVVGNNLRLTATVNPIPEPSTALLAGLALLGLGFVRRRRTG